MREEWSKARVISAVAALEDAGLGRRKLSEIAGVDHSTIGRWARGDVQPAYAAVRRLAVGIWRQHPDAAREIVEASGYPWVEPSATEAPPPSPLEDLLGSAEDAEQLRRKIRARKGPQAERLIGLIEEALSEPAAGESEPPGPGARRDRRQG